MIVAMASCLLSRGRSSAIEAGPLAAALFFRGGIAKLKGAGVGTRAEAGVRAKVASGGDAWVY